MKNKIILSTLTFSLAAATVATISSCAVSQNVKTNNSIESSSNDEPEFVTPETDMDKPESQVVEQPKVEKEPAAPYGRVVETTIHFMEKEGQTNVEWMGSRYITGIVGRQFCSIKCPDAIRKGYHVAYWLEQTSPGVYRKLEATDLIKKDMIIYPFFESDVQLKNCLALSALSDSTVSIVNHGEGQRPNLSYSYNGINWTDYYEGTEEAGQTSLDVKSGEVVYFRGRNYQSFSSSESNYTSFSVGGSINLYGNVMTLIDDGQGTTTVIPNNYCFYKLFEGCAGISSISSNFLPATDLTNYCYAYMFNNCVGITAFPSSLLPATTLSHEEDEEKRRGTGAMCYTCMFSGCIGITSVPTHLLPATDLSTYCYYGMFSGCTGITELKADVLPATVLKYGCYYGMFALCKNLTDVDPNFLYPKNTETPDPDDRIVPHLASRCYGSLFASCYGEIVDGTGAKTKTGLTDMSDLVLPADNLSVAPVDQPGQESVKVYEEMFYGCKALTNAPALNATYLGNQCYYSMFYNCVDLTTAPTLGASVAKEECYMNMFHNCDKLTTIPTLSAMTLDVRCYKGMFTNCDGLTDLSTKSLPAYQLKEGCYENMFQASSVQKSPAFGTVPSGQTGRTARDCCRHMFYKCTQLTASPALPATIATPYCYYEMFRWCEKLTTVGVVSLSGIVTGTNADYCCYIMFGECSSLSVSRTAGGSRKQILGIGNWGTECYENIFQNTASYPGQGSYDTGTWYQ